MKRLDLQELLGPMTSDTVLFTFEDTAISDPWLSECTRFEVNPVTYYGKDFLDIFNGAQLKLLIADGMMDELDVIRAYNNEWWDQEIIL